MNLTRVLTGVIGLPIVAIILIFGNKYIIDVLFAVVALISIYEYFHAIEKQYKPIKWLRIYFSITYCIYAYNTTRSMDENFDNVYTNKYSNFIHNCNNNKHEAKT